MFYTKFLLVGVLGCCSMLMANRVMSQDLAYPQIGARLSDSQVSSFAKLALKGIEQEYPNKPSNVMVGPESVLSPKQMHPAFFGCFDWHSSVHGHWMLVRLLKLYPEATIAPAMREALEKRLTEENLQAEVRYFAEKENRSFERMYGWAWLLRLAAELHTWEDPQGKKWRNALRPLEERIVELTGEYLPRLSFPIRTGVHPDTPFALGQVLDYARIVGNKSLEKLVCDRARSYFENDRDYPARFEPSGEDFFSTSLNEADLMRRVLEPQEFAAWLERFLPTAAQGKLNELYKPVEVTDVTDGKLVHLAGLDLSRAWTLMGIASVLPANSSQRAQFQELAKAHAEMGYRYVFSGHYEGEHWLATFAIYMHTESGY